METHQFRIRISKEAHTILKRVACDEDTTMTALFMEMFELWLKNYQLNQKIKDNSTTNSINRYWKEKKSCK